MGRRDQVSTTGKNYEETAFVKSEEQPWASERKEREKVASLAGLEYVKMGKQQGGKMKLVDRSCWSFIWAEIRFKK